MHRIQFGLQKGPFTVCFSNRGEQCIFVMFNNSVYEVKTNEEENQKPVAYFKHGKHTNKPNPALCPSGNKILRNDTDI